MVLCAFCPNPLTGKSHYKDEYLNRVERYKQSNTAQLFEDALAHQLCMYLQIDIIEIYKRAHPDETIYYTELKDTLRFANWQGVEIIQ